MRIDGGRGETDPWFNIGDMRCDALVGRIPNARSDDSLRKSSEVDSWPQAVSVYVEHSCVGRRLACAKRQVVRRSKTPPHGLIGVAATAEHREAPASRQPAIAIPPTETKSGIMSKLRIAALSVASLFVACSSDSETPTELPDPTPVLPVSVQIDPTSLAVRVNGSVQITAVAIDPSGATVTNPQLTWSTSNQEVATVTSSGGATATVRGTGAGQAAIEVSAGSRRARAVVTSSWALPSPGRRWFDFGLASTRRSLWDAWGSSPSDVWFVGEAGTVLHFDGTAFRQSPSGTGADFRGVHGTGSAVWAVGVNDDGTGEIRRHRDGRWLPELVPAITAHINDVWASSDLDAWAVGWAGDRGIALRSNGSSWAEFQLPNGVTALKGVWGSGPEDVWMVGDNVVLHFNGQTMEPAGPSVIGGLRSVWGVGPDRLWAVGDGQVLSYAEGTWTDITSDVPLGPSGVPDYRAVSGVGDADVWIASNDGMLALFDGVSWTSVERDTSWDVNGVWGTRDVVWALSGASGGVFVGADPSEFPMPTAEVARIFPDSQTAGEYVTVRGTGFPTGLDATHVRIARAGVTFPAGPHSIPYGGLQPRADPGTDLLVRLPRDLTPGPATLEVLNAFGAPVATTVDLQIAAGPVPVIVDAIDEMSWDASGGGCRSLDSAAVSDGEITIGQERAVGVRAHGLHSAGAQVQILQKDRAWPLSVHCGHWTFGMGPMGIVARLPAPEAASDDGSGQLTSGPAQFRVRSAGTAWSEPWDFTIVLP